MGTHDVALLDSMALSLYSDEFNESEWDMDCWFLWGWQSAAVGFIASHLAKRLKSEGHYIVACDWKRNEHMLPVSLLLSDHLSIDKLFQNFHKQWLWSQRSAERIEHCWLLY